MCGIVGYVGDKSAVGIILEGLKRLEYRGYDSAGIAVLAPSGTLEVRRAAGRIKNLEGILRERPLTGAIGIGHTRWATHGRPSDDNAHPHTDCSGTLVVVHNGILENYLEIKERLQAQGHTFKSETDTEVIAHLIEHHLKTTPRLERAVKWPSSRPAAWCSRRSTISRCSASRSESCGIRSWPRRVATGTSCSRRSTSSRGPSPIPSEAGSPRRPVRSSCPT